MELNINDIKAFQDTIWSFFILNKRMFPWRYIEDPYKVLVSEIMLQQTQTFRVQEKYFQFITRFNNFTELADASLHEVLSCWQGLGYNRRGKYLQNIAQIVVKNYHGQLPRHPEILEELPGIGKYTAASVCAFAYNMPTVFIETNIRAVYIYSFFGNKEQVHDKELFPLIESTLDHKNPREWYYALMDYGVYLKKWFKNPAKKSAHYTKQTKFEGSDRQIRGLIIKTLVDHYKVSVHELYSLIERDTDRIDLVLQQLSEEKLISWLPNNTITFGDAY